MAKYGWFKRGGLHPDVEYEGDYMKMDKEFVQIFQNGNLKADPMATPRLVAAIRLDKGQDVREIK